MVTNLDTNTVLPNGTTVDVELGRSRRYQCSNNRTIGNGSIVLVRWAGEVSQCISNVSRFSKYFLFKKLCKFCFSKVVINCRPQ